MVVEVNTEQFQLSIKDFLFGDHGIHDVVDLRAGILGLFSVWMRGHDALVQIDGFVQVLRLVVRRKRRRVLSSSLCFTNGFFHVSSPNFPSIKAGQLERDPSMSAIVCRFIYLMQIPSQKIYGVNAKGADALRGDGLKMQSK